MTVNTRLLFIRLLRAMRINFVCDIGSMDGADALLFRAALPQASIHAFEPHPENFRRMRTDPALRQGNVTVESLAISNHDGTSEFFTVDAAQFPDDGWRGMSSLHRRQLHGAPEPTVVNVRTARLDSFFAGQCSADSRIALWIDTEGKAFEVIEGAQALLRNVYLVHVEVETRPLIGATQRLYPDVKQRLHSAGLLEIAKDKSASRPQFNVLFVRRDLPMLMACHVKALCAAALARRLAGRVRARFHAN